MRRTTSYETVPQDVRMPLGDLIEGVAQEFGQVALELLSYGTGYVIVPMFTLGRVRVSDRPASQRQNKTPSQRKAPAPRLISPEWGAAVGLIFWVVIAAGSIAAYNWWPSP